MENNNLMPVPKRSCLFTLMFAVKDDKEALDIKEIVDEAIKHIENKRYSFQINENPTQ